jgi:hypothetical protein
MSIDKLDLYEYGVESDCCGAGVYLNGICSCCNDHCTPVDSEIEDTEKKLMDLYRDVGMSPSDFI